MGISADIIILNEKPRMGEHYAHVALDQIEHLNLDLDSETKVLYGKEIIYVGSGHSFNKNVLENYDKNQGFFSLKDGISYIENNRKKEVIEELEKIFYNKIEYIYEKKSIILTLNY